MEQCEYISKHNFEFLKDCSLQKDIIPFPHILNMKKLLHVVYGCVKRGGVNSGAAVTSEGGRKGGWELRGQYHLKHKWQMITCIKAYLDA